VRIDEERYGFVVVGDVGMVGMRLSSRVLVDWLYCCLVRMMVDRKENNRRAVVVVVFENYDCGEILGVTLVMY